VIRTSRKGLTIRPGVVLGSVAQTGNSISATYFTAARLLIAVEITDHEVTELKVLKMLSIVIDESCNRAVKSGKNGGFIFFTQGHVYYSI
jgi:hypothetical protein